MWGFSCWQYEHAYRLIEDPSYRESRYKATELSDHNNHHAADVPSVPSRSQYAPLHRCTREDEDDTHILAGYLKK